MSSARARLLAPLVVSCMALLLAGVTAWRLDRATSDAEAVRLQADVTDMQRAIVSRLDTQISVLRGLAALLAVEPSPDASAFSVFVHRSVRSEFAGMQGLGLAVRLRPGEEAALAARSGVEGWHVWPPQTDQAERYPILFLEPHDRRNLKAMGYDMYSEAVRREAMARARDTGNPAASARVILVQEIDVEKQAGFLVYVPVYEGGDIPPTMEERREKILGFAYSPFRAGDLLHSVLEGGDPGLDLDVYDGEGVDLTRLLYRFGQGGGQRPQLTTVDIAGRPWTLAVDPPDGGAAVHAPALLVIGGGIVSALLFALLFGQLRARAAAEQAASDLRASQEALRQNELRLHRLVETNVVAIAIVDREGLVREANPAFLALVGWRPEDVRDRALRWQDLTAPELAPLLESAIRDLARTGSMPPRERVLTRRDGGRMPILLGAAWLGGEEDLWVAIIVDLTDQKHAQEALGASEARFRTIVDQSPISMQFFTPDGRVRAVNPGFERLWGLTLADLADYSILEDPQLEAKGILPYLHRGFAGVTTTIPPIPYVPFSGPNKDREIWVRAVIYPVRDEHGRIREVVLIHEDITEQRRAEDALLQAQKLESIGVLAGGIAHDFNNLLTGVLGNASLATRYVPPGSRARALLDDVQRAAERAAALTRQLLAYAGKGRFHVERVDAVQLVRDITGLLRSSISRKVRLDVELGDEPLWIEADATQVQQLLMNLVLNAAEAIGDEPGRVTVTSRPRVVPNAEANERWTAWKLRGGPFVELCVRDTGVGMDTKTREQIFEPFFTTKFVGRGLGLAAALGIVRGHGGAIDVWSEPGRGSLFTVLLPRAEASTRPMAEVAPAPPPRLGQGTVLVVDDEEALREVAQATLEEDGWTVLLARDGLEAETVLRAHPEIGVVLLDMTMPRLGGEEALARMRAFRPEVRVVVTSGWSEEEAQRRLAGLRVEGFLPKPWSADALVRVMAEVGAGVSV